jgi:hypothetical protein
MLAHCVKRHKRPRSLSAPEVVSMETQNKNIENFRTASDIAEQNSDVNWRARSLIAKAKYLAKVASDQEIDVLIRRDISKAVFYIYKCAFHINGSNEQEIASQLLSEAAKQAGI